MDAQEMMDRVKAQTGAADVDIPKRVSENVWSVRVAYADGPDAYTFDSKLFEVEDDRIRVWGF